MALEAGERERGGGNGSMRDSRGHDTGKANSRGQGLEEGKEARNSSNVNETGVEGLQTCNRFGSLSCPSVDTYGSGM